MAELILEYKFRYIKTAPILSLSTIYLLKFGTVPTVVIFFWFLILPFKYKIFCTVIMYNNIITWT